MQFRKKEKNPFSLYQVLHYVQDINFSMFQKKIIFLNLHFLFMIYFCHVLLTSRYVLTLNPIKFYKIYVFIYIIRYRII